MIPRSLIAIFLVVILVFSLVFFTVGYYVGYRIGYDAAYLTPLRIGHLVADIHQIAFFIAYYEGYYSDERIRPIRLEYINGPAEMMALAAGDLDAGYVGVVPALIAKSQGVDLMIVASANLEGSAIVAKANIQEVQDLNGSRVGTPGIGTIQDSLLYMVEKRFNITVTRYHMKTTDLPLAFERNDIDAFIAWEPFAAEVVVRGLGNVIYTSRDILPNHQCCVLYVSGKMFREQKDFVKRLIQIHLKAMTIALQQPDDAMEIFANRTDVTMTVIQESWQRMIWDHHLNTTSVKIFVNYLIEQGKIRSEDVPDVDAFLNATLDQQLLTEVETIVS